MRLIEKDSNEVVSLEEALNVARERGQDLIEITDKADPPICKIVDFRRFLYDEKQKSQKGKGKKSETKEFRFGPNIGDNDLRLRIARAREFLSENDKVKVTVLYRGRQITHQEFGRAKMDTFLKELEDVARVEAAPRLIGKMLSATLGPK